MTEPGIEKQEPGGDFLARLVSELGRAAHAGWAPTARWLVFLVVIAGALALLAVLGR